MSLRKKITHNLAARRLIGWTLGAALLAAGAGCTTFQQIGTAHWLDAPWPDMYPGHAPRVNQALTYWDHGIHTIQNTAAGNVPVPGLAGRLVLFAEGSIHPVDAGNGKVKVELYDMSGVAPGIAPKYLGQWTFDPDTLRRLKRTDKIGDGYTLVVPWPDYRPDLQKVQLQVYYLPKDGQPVYADPVFLTLNAGARETPVLHQQNYTTVPGAKK